MARSPTTTSERSRDRDRSGKRTCGGTRARTWEWNGHRLVAGPWHQVSNGTPPPTTVAPTKSAAPCTAKVITAIAKPGVRNFYNVDGFGCSGGFAYAFVTVASPQHRPIAEITALLTALKGTWHLASRAIYCENGSVPPGDSSVRGHRHRLGRSCGPDQELDRPVSAGLRPITVLLYLPGPGPVRPSGGREVPDNACRLGRHRRRRRHP